MARAGSAVFHWRTPVRKARLTVAGWGADDDAMNEVISSTPRRSARAFHKMRVEAQGRTHDRKKFKETCETVVVSAHGGLLLLKHEVDSGEMLVLTNLLTQEEQECRIVYLGERLETGRGDGLECMTPATRLR